MFLARARTSERPEAAEESQCLVCLRNESACLVDATSRFSSHADCLGRWRFGRSAGYGSTRRAGRPSINGSCSDFCNRFGDTTWSASQGDSSRLDGRSVFHGCLQLRFSGCGRCLSDPGSTDKRHFVLCRRAHGHNRPLGPPATES
jgi:hypothetical protein